MSSNEIITIIERRPAGTKCLRVASRSRGVQCG